MKKSLWYMITFVLGVILIITGIFTLNEAITEKDTSRIWVRSLMLLLWIAFTISNFFLYRKEIKKSKDV